MIYLEQEKVFIKCPCEAEDLTKEILNYLRENLEKGYCVFVTPDDFNELEISNVKKHKKNYKVGFIYDMLTFIYPEYGKEKKHQIIADKYHLWFSYRQFKDVLDEYEQNRKKYIKKRDSL